MKANKLKKNKGFTLVESTVALLMVTFITAMLLMISNLAKDTYVELEKNSQGQVLSAVLINNIQDELRYASSIEATDDPDANGNYHFTYYSEASQMAQCEIVAHEYKGSAKKIYIKFGGNYKPVTGNSSYVYDLQADVDTKYDPDHKYFLVTLRIYDDDDREIIKTDFIVEPLNPYTL